MILWCLSFSSRDFWHILVAPEAQRYIVFAWRGKFLLFLQTSLVWPLSPGLVHPPSLSLSWAWWGYGHWFVEVPTHRWDKLQTAIEGPASAHRNRIQVRQLTSCMGRVSSVKVALVLGYFFTPGFSIRPLTGSGMAQLGDGVTDSPRGAVLLGSFCSDTLQWSYWASS